jgi:hypothetical protein
MGQLFGVAIASVHSAGVDKSYAADLRGGTDTGGQKRGMNLQHRQASQNAAAPRLHFDGGKSWEALGQ